MLLLLSLIDTYDEKVCFEKLYRKYKEDMYKVAYAVVHNQYDAEDAVHNAFIAIIRNLSVVDGLEPVKQKAYVCRAARNHAINIQSKQNRDRQFVLVNAHEPCLSNDDDDILNEICSKMRVEQIKNCILSLPETYRDVLFLHYVNNLNSRQIANILGLKAPSVRQRICRGKRMLIENLEELEVNVCEKEQRPVAQGI